MNRQRSFDFSLGKLSLPELRRAGIELDQKLLAAFRIGADIETFDSQIFHALNRMNVVSTRILEIDHFIDRIEDSSVKRTHLIDPDYVDRYQDEFPIGSLLAQVLERAIDIRASYNSLGTGDFISALIDLCLEHEEDYGSRPHTADLLAIMWGGEKTTPLHEIPQLYTLINKLKHEPYRAEDFQYIITLEENRIVFRTTSILDDYVQVNDSGLLIPKRGLLTHFQEQFGVFTSEQVLVLEELLNNPKAREIDFQRFFEENPYFFRKWDYREVYPHIYLTRESDGPLIPDFILTDKETQKAMIIELKLPTPTVIRRQKNRDRFASSVMEARSQLLQYRDWFRDRKNRHLLKEKVGMEIYEPHLAVIIGRSQEFVDELDRQMLRANNPDIEVVTYDDILRFAERRRLLIQPRD